MNDLSKLASCFPFWSSLAQSKRARVKEHRLTKNIMDLVCRLPRAPGLTRLLHLILVCAFGEQGRPTALVLFPIAGAGTTIHLYAPFELRKRRN